MKQVPPKHDLTEPRSWMALFWAYNGWLAVAGTVLAIAVTWLSVAEYRSAAQFERFGVVIDAEVEAGRAGRDGDGNDYFYITFRFDADGHTVSRERQVSSSLYEGVRQGDLIEIRYLPDDPHNFETEIGETHTNAVAAQYFAGISGLVTLATLWFLGQKANRAVLARKFGYRDVAVIESVFETKNSGKPSGNGYLIWRTSDGARGESLTHPIRKLRAIGEGAEINVYVRRGHSVWEGDVGPRHEGDSNLPKVPRN